LLSRGVDVNAVNDKGSTALMMAAFFGRTENARILVAKGANIRLRDNAGDTALDIARKEKSEDVVALLLAAAKTPGGRAAGR
jgi:ankyrin repeat protein